MRNLTATCLIAALATGVGGLVALDPGFVVAQNLRKVTSAQIRARFAGMQLTDEVHYRMVFGRDGTLRSVELGVKKRGQWAVNKDQLCLYLGETDDGCYEIMLDGDRVVMTPAGLGGSIDGILQPADEN